MQSATYRHFGDDALGAARVNVIANAQLRKENRELARANEILQAAASFFGAELDRQSKRSPRS